MTQRADLVRAIQGAGDGRSLTAAVAALDNYDRQRAGAQAQERELDMAGHHVTAALTPVPLHERHTAATDWLMDYEAPSDYRTAMIALASAWYSGLDPAVREDGGELREQAFMRSASLAGRYGDFARQAQQEFLRYVAFLAREAASGLPQIQQLIDPNNQPAATPLPTEPFDNFAPPQNDYNGGVEGENHDSQISSEQAPLVQQVQQQDAGGSGYGAGPERPAMHTTQMDTSNSYSEVPLGTPGQIPTTPAPTSGSQGTAQSTPNPVAGSDQVADDNPLQQAMGQPAGDGDDDEDDRRRQASWTPPDAAGFRWLARARTAEAPFHTACKAEHWPDAPCGGGTRHTASVAVGYTASFDDVARTVALEKAGMAEGQHAIQAAQGSLRALAAHHNRLVQAYSGGDQTAEDSAVLHGFMAVVRPVIAGAGCGVCGHPSHLGEPCPHEGCRCRHNKGEEGAGPGMHARTIGHVPDPDSPGYSKKRD